MTTNILNLKWAREQTARSWSKRVYRLNITFGREISAYHGVFECAWSYFDHFVMWSLTLLLFEVKYRVISLLISIESSYWTVSVPNPGGGQQIQTMIVHRGLWRRCEELVNNLF